MVWIAMKFGLDVHVTLRLNFNDFDVLLTFHLAPSPGQKFMLSSILFFDRNTFKTNEIPISLSCIFPTGKYQDANTLN